MGGPGQQANGYGLNIRWIVFRLSAGARNFSLLQKRPDQLYGRANLLLNRHRWPVAKRPGLELGYSSPSSAEAKNECSYTSIPPYAFTVWTDNFTHRAGTSQSVQLSRIRSGLLTNSGSIPLQRQEIFCSSEVFRPPLRLAELLSMGTVTSLSRNKATMVWSWPLSPIYYRG